MSIQPRMTKVMVLASVTSLMPLGSFLRTGVGCELGRSPGTRSAAAFGHGGRAGIPWGADGRPGTQLQHLGPCLVNQAGDPARRCSLLVVTGGTRKAPSKLQDS